MTDTFEFPKFKCEKCSDEVDHIYKIVKSKDDKNKWYCKKCYDEEKRDKKAE